MLIWMWSPGRRRGRKGRFASDLRAGTPISTPLKHNSNKAKFNVRHGKSNRIPRRARNIEGEHQSKTRFQVLQWRVCCRTV